MGWRELGLEVGLERVELELELERVELELELELESEVWSRLEMVQMCQKVLEMWSRGVEVQS